MVDNNTLNWIWNRKTAERRWITPPDGNYYNCVRDNSLTVQKPELTQNKDDKESAGRNNN